MKFSKKPILLFIAAALTGFILLANCAGGPQPVQREAGKVYELVLLHTNDHHGAIDPTGTQGGLAERATFISQVRAENANVLLLDAGDMNTGQALSNMFSAEPDILAYNYMGYDATTFGNHEFDKDRATLLQQMAWANFPFLTANIMDGNKLLGGNQYKVFNYEGIRVGVFGVTIAQTPILTNPLNLRGLTFTNEIEAARNVVNILRSREKVDIVIALTHMGEIKINDDHITSHELAQAVTGIDIILDGHSHTLSTEVARFGETSLVQAGNWGKWVGQARLSVIDGKLTGFDWESVEISGFAPDAAVAAILAPFRERADAILQEVIGQAAGDFPHGRQRYEETAIGNMITDGIAWWARNVQNLEVDFAFSNGGGIRAPLSAGQLTRGDIITVLPFDNYVNVASLTGAELQELFNFIATIAQGAGAFPQFSADVRYTRNITEGTVTDITIGGAPIDPARVYRFATNDFVLAGGDGYPLTSAGNRLDTSMRVADVVIDFIIQSGGTVTPALDGRVVVTGGN